MLGKPFRQLINCLTLVHYLFIFFNKSHNCFYLKMLNVVERLNILFFKEKWLKFVHISFKGKNIFPICMFPTVWWFLFYIMLTYEANIEINCIKQYSRVIRKKIKKLFQALHHVRYKYPETMKFLIQGFYTTMKLPK